MNNNYYPDIMYDMIEQRHTDIRNREAAHRLAEQVQRRRPNRLKLIVNGISAFSKRLTSKQADAAEIQVTIRERQA